MDDYFSLTPEHAKKITGATFTFEELKDRRILLLIRTMECNKIVIESQRDFIDLLSKELEKYKPKTTAKDHSKAISDRPNPQSSRAFLRIVS